MAWAPPVLAARTRTSPPSGEYFTTDIALAVISVVRRS
jgi:hypothetical protein